MQQVIPGIFLPEFATDTPNRNFSDLLKKNLVLGRRGKIGAASDALPIVDLLGHLLDPGARPAEGVQAEQ